MCIAANQRHGARDFEFEIPHDEADLQHRLGQFFRQIPNDRRLRVKHLGLFRNDELQLFNLIRVIELWTRQFFRLGLVFATEHTSHKCR